MRFVLLLLSALIVVFVAVTAIKWPENGSNGENLIALPSWMPVPHQNKSVETTEESAQPAEESLQAQEPVKAEEPEAAEVVSTPTQTANTVDVLVAQHTLPVGTVIESATLEQKTIPAKSLPAHYIKAENADQITGRVVRSSFQPNEPITTSKLSDPSDRNYLANELPSGMRAITLAVDAVSGVGGYLYAGDRVDVVYTHNIPQELNAKGDYKNTAYYRPVASEVIAPNVRVLAINARAGKDSSAQPLTNVTIELSDEYAQRLRLAERLGILSLSLRSPKDNNTNVPRPTYVKDLTHAYDTAPKKKMVSADYSGVKIIRGGASVDKPCSTNPCVIQ